MAQKPVQGPSPFAQGLSDLSRRMRVLEERYTVLRRKGQLTDENLIAAEKDLRNELARLAEDVKALYRKLLEIDEKMDRFLEEVKGAAPRQEVLVLRKYLEMWDPVRYLTREEAQRLLEQAR